MVQNPPAVQETWVRPLVRMIPWWRKWQPTPVILPGKFHEQRTWWTTVHGVTKESDETEWLTFSLLIGWWWSDRVALQDSCAQPKVAILHLGSCLSSCRNLSSCRRTQRHCCLCHLGRTALSLQCCLSIAPPSFLHSFTSREQLFGSVLRYSGKVCEAEVSFLQTRNGRHRKDLYAEGPHRVLLSFTRRKKNSPCFLDRREAILPKPLCDLSLATMLARPQLLVILREVQKCRHKGKAVS